MKRKSFLAGLAVVMLLACSLAILVACGEKKDPVDTDEIVYGKTETQYAPQNPYANLSGDDYKAFIGTSISEMSSAVVYQFEGSYCEAWQGDMSRDYFYFNCYADGLMLGRRIQNGDVGSFTNVMESGGNDVIVGKNNDSIFGYWTNRDRRGNQKLELHIMRYLQREYKTNLLCTPEPNPDAYYEYSTDFSFEKYSNQLRTVKLFGFKYTPVVKLEADMSEAQTEYDLFEQFNDANIKLTVTRENGKSMQLDNVSSFIDERPNQNHTPRPIYRANGIRYIGFDSSEPGDKKLIIRYRDCATTIDYKIKSPTYVGTGTYDDNETEIKISLISAKICKVEIDGKTINCKYTLKDGIIVLSLPDEKDDVELGVTEEEWDKLHKKYCLMVDGETGEYTVEPYNSLVLIVPDGDYDHVDFVEGNQRQVCEIATNPPGGNTQNRQIILNLNTGVATLTYRYWYGETVDTWQLKFTIEGDKLTFTERISGSSAAGITFNTLYKEYRIVDDAYAVRYDIEIKK